MHRAIEFAFMHNSVFFVLAGSRLSLFDLRKAEGVNLAEPAVGLNELELKVEGLRKRIEMRKASESAEVNGAPKAEKKKRGRPRKNPLADPNIPKRGRGRPRKQETT